MSVREGSCAPHHDLDQAIWRTIAYASLFQYPLRPAELQRRLVDVAAGESQLLARLFSPSLRPQIALRDGFVFPMGCEAWVDLRRARHERTDRLLAQHDRALRTLAHVPFVRMVALSGACAHGNASDDDVDVFLITHPARAWAVTLFLMIASKLAGLRRSLCINYILAEDGMALPERDRFTAAEIVGLRPLAGRGVYHRFVRANDWIAPLHPNFWESYEANSAAVHTAVGAPRIEAVLDGLGAGLFERLARRALEPYLRRRLHGPGVALSASRLKLHAYDHRPSVGRALDAALAPPAAVDEEALRGVLRA
jgi:hypothetical protein